jgi:hypothetical protein
MIRPAVLALLIWMGLIASVVAQTVPSEDDPCGFGLRKGSEISVWGYTRAALIVDMQRWALHPWIQFDVVGESVQRRPLYHIVLTNPSSQQPKRRIWIHARTHPLESESSFVARAIVDELLSGSSQSQQILDHCIVHLLPMLNPDGVELGYARENANGVDLESNWGSADPEPEVRALRTQLIRLMDSGNAIDIALNLHSAYTCKRYFVYHAAAGTSVLFTQMEQRFINAARSRFPGGIEPYDFFVSWTGGTPDRYPESWFWMNYGENVMALTYEDMNCTSAGDFEKTARAILGGAAEYLNIGGTTTVNLVPDRESVLRIEALYPQPVRTGATLSLRLRAGRSQRHVTASVHDLLGRNILPLWDGPLAEGTRMLTLQTGALRPGTYLLRLQSAEAVSQQTVIVF